MKKITLILYITFSYLAIFSQDTDSLELILNNKNSDTIPTDPKISKLRMYLTYSSTNSFLGKKDSIAIPLIRPAIKYTHWSGLFTKIALVHTSTTSKAFDELDFSLGYQFNIGNHWDGSISYARFFFSKDVSRITSLVNNNLNAYFAYDFDWLYSAISFDYSSGSKTYIKAAKKGKNPSKTNSVTTSLKDYTFTLMNSKAFNSYDVFIEDDKLIISPEVDLYIGTQNNVIVYHKKITTSNTASSLNLKSAVVNLDVMYVYKNGIFNLSPYVNFPIIVSEGETNNPFFVLYGGFYYTLRWQKK